MVPAILGTARLGNFRLGYVPAALVPIRATKVRILLAGADVSVRVSGLSIDDAINDTPNRCTLVIASPPPIGGQSLRVSINSDNPRTLFVGTIQQDDLTYEGKKTQLVYPCRAIDDTARLTRRRPFGTWVNTSVTTIAQSIIASYAPGFTSTYVQVGLPSASIIFDGTDDFAVALKRLATAIGGYWYVEDSDVHLFTTEATNTPDPIQTGYPFCDDPPIRATTDVSQLRTRQCGKGHGEKVVIDVSAGETILPIEDAVMFNPLGGRAIAGTTPDGAQSQLITYVGTTQDSVGSTVGPSVSPSVAPILALVSGSGLSLGAYLYAYTFVTAVGESLPSPIATITTVDALAVPGVLTPNAPTAGFPYVDAGNHDYVVTFVTSAGETLPGSASASVTTTSTNQVVPLSDIPIGGPTVIARRIYRRFNGAGTYKLVTTVNNNTATLYGDGIANAFLGVAAPSVDTSEAKRVAVSVALGPSGTSARNVYRTTVGGSQLKLQQTIANNTATAGVTDSTVDGSLGANAPTSNTSGLSSSGVRISGFFTASPVTFSTNGAATSANTASPVFTSASYTFVAADVGARLYIKTGTNWTPGLYTIVSVAAGAATVAGPIASVASPTSGTWGVDYSAFVSPRVTFTDLVIDATTSTKFTSAAFPVGPNYIGNVVNISNSVGFVEQAVVVLSVSGTVATCDKVLGTLSSTAGRGLLGGAQVLPFVVAGSTSLITASAGPFAASGGWIQIGRQFVRYTGVTGNTLTGIPSIGSTGALLDTVAYGEHISVMPALTGVAGLVLAMQRGTPVHIWVQRDDLTAQATQAVLDAANGLSPADGIYEGPPIVDQRRGEDSLIALCDATLALFSTPIVTITYATRDTKTKSGKPITVNLSSPPISQTLTIQNVNIGEIDIAPRLAPKFLVEASTWSTSLEDLLRRMTASLDES